MSSQADVIAVGTFRPAIAMHLDYPANWYEGVPEGTQVITTVLAVHTARESLELAAALGVNVDDFVTHHLGVDPEPDWLKLEELLESIYCRERAAELLAGFKALIAAGFEFFYRPNC